MNIIEKIEIKHFRSFLGTPQKYETRIEKLTGLNIFSGANDSGKSNLLRVLNLFFNDQISQGLPFEFERDFFTGKKDAGHKVVEISISFNLVHDLKRDKFLPDKFTISKFYDRNGFRNYLYSFSLKGVSEPIKVDSRAENNKDLKRFFISEKSTEQEKKNAEKREWNYRVKFSGFLNKSISFEYIPAIRDKNFFAQLFGRVITKIKTNEDHRIEELKREKLKIKNWEKTLKNKTEKKDLKENLKKPNWRKERLDQIDQKITEEPKLTSTIKSLEEEINTYSKNLISSISFIDSEFKIGKNLQDFFEGFDFGTGEGKSISIGLRGDGIQAKFVPKILNFLSEIDTEKKYFLWGFEEPENSAEYKNQQELAAELKTSLSKKKQIFLTTHSEEFLQLYDGIEVEINKRNSNLYHVKKTIDSEYGEYSQVFLFDVDKNEFEFANQKAHLDKELGQSYLRAKHSKELKTIEDQFIEEKTKILKDNQDLRTLLNQSSKPLLCIEDKHDDLYKIAWLRINKIDFSKKNLPSTFEKESPFLIHKAEGATNLAGFLRMKNTGLFKDRKIIGLFDFDEAGRLQFKSLKDKTHWKNQESGEKLSGIHKRRADHFCFYALLLPIPEHLSHLADFDFPSFVEIENLLPERFLKNHYLAEVSKTTGFTEYLKIKDDKKQALIDKSFELTAEDFSHFQPLFKKIEEILKTH